MKLAKSILSPLVLVSLAGCLAACSTTSTTTSATGVVTTTTKAPLTPQQLAAKLCPPAKVALNNFSQLQGLTPDALKGIATATADINTICADGSTFDITDIQTMVNTGMPILLSVVKASVLTEQQQNDLTMAVGAVQTAYAFAQAVNTP